MADSQASFDDFVARNGDSLLRTAHLITLDQGEAEDLVQECLLKLSQRWGRVSRMDQPLAYARRMLVNLATRGSEHRSRRRAELSVDVVEDGAISSGLELLGERQALFAALRGLTSHQRTVLVLRYFHDLSETQTADALGCTVGTVRSTTSRSLVRLLNLLESASTNTRSDH